MELVSRLQMDENCASEIQSAGDLLFERCWERQKSLEKIKESVVSQCHTLRFIFFQLCGVFDLCFSRSITSLAEGNEEEDP